MGVSAATAVIAAIGTGHAIESSEQQKRKAGQIAKGQLIDTKNIEEQKKIKDQQLLKEKEQKMALNRQKAMQANFGGRQSTILTGSLGGSSQPSAPAAKTVLGA